MKRKMLVRLLVTLVAICLVSGSAFSQTKKAEAKKPDLIDINSASKQELMTLPGVGEAISQKIIDGRQWRAKNELLQKKIVNQPAYDKISPLIIAKQSTSAAAKKTEKKK